MSDGNPAWTGKPQEWERFNEAFDEVVAHMNGAVSLIGALTERLDRITAWHTRETAGGGMATGRCIECGLRWPCDTRRMADGTYEERDG